MSAADSQRNIASMISIRESLQRARERWTSVQTLHYLLVQAAYRAGLRRHQSGAVHAGWDIDQMLRYVHGVFDDYLAYGGIDRAALDGMRVLEIGPGATLGVALLFVAHGAEEVVCVDRFESDRDEEANRNLYAAIVRSLDGQRRDRAAACLDAHGNLRPGPVKCFFGRPVEQIDRAFPAESFDLVVSRAVLEHVYSPEDAWRSMDHVLRANGRMLHKVDFRCHSFYEDKHPLHFLTVPEWLWLMVSAPDPTLNRARLSCYSGLLAKYGYQARMFVTHVADDPAEITPHIERTAEGYRPSPGQMRMLEDIRPRLTDPFRTASHEDLIVNGAFVVGTKPDRR